MPKAGSARETDPSGQENPDAKVDEASSQDQAEQTRAAESGPSEVKYVGEAGTREISKADWKAAGIEHPAVVWNADNEYTVPASEFSGEALDLLKRDRNLKIK